MSEANKNKNEPFDILPGGGYSRAETLEVWDKWGQEGKVKQMSPFDKEKGFSVWQDESGKYFRVDFQPQKEGMVSTNNDRKQTFANIVSLSEQEVKDILG